MKNIEKVYEAISGNPELLDRIFEQKAEDAPVTRGMPWMNAPQENEEIRKILGGQVSEQDVNDVLNELEGNQIVQLYRQSVGSIDAKELVNYVGDLSGAKAGSDAPALRALFDGKLQLKEIILLILLLKLFKKKQNQTVSYTNSSSGLLNALLGTQSQPSVTNNLFSSLFGTPQTQSYGFTNLYPSSNSNSLFSLLGLGGTGSNYNTNYNALNNFLSGNNLNQNQLQLYNLLGNQASNSVYGSGQVSVNSLFSILGQLLGAR